MTLHLRFFDGGNAVSDFKVQQILPRLAGISDKITGLSARFVHLASFDAAPDAATLDRVGQLMAYGEPATEAHLALEKAGAPALLVMPRLGTVSPWASKATDIAHNCGLTLHRVERLVEFRIGLKSGLLGKALFSSTERQNNRRERLFILTPRVIGDQDDPSRYLPQADQAELQAALTPLARRISPHEPVIKRSDITSTLAHLVTGQVPQIKPGAIMISASHSHAAGPTGMNWPSICGVSPTVTQGLHWVIACSVWPPIVTLAPLICCGPFVFVVGFFCPFAATT